MLYWSWWLGGAALASAVLVHWLLLKRMMGVSGRVSALVDRIRSAPAEQLKDLDADELAEAIRAETVKAFGSAAIEPTQDCMTPPVPRTPQSVMSQGLFFVGLALGGFISVWSAGAWQPLNALHSETFYQLFHGPVGPGMLVLGGVFVGFGTRMAGGCTSGHGLVGTSLFQPGSLLSTAMFFSTGVILSLLLGGLR